MIQMTDSQLEEYIKSKQDVKYVDTYYETSERFKSNIGVLRMLFNFEEDPKAFTSVIGEESTELWVLGQDNNWKRSF